MKLLFITHKKTKTNTSGVVKISKDIAVVEPPRIYGMISFRKFLKGYKKPGIIAYKKYKKAYNSRMFLRFGGDGGLKLSGKLYNYNEQQYLVDKATYLLQSDCNDPYTCQRLLEDLQHAKFKCDDLFRSANRKNLGEKGNIILGDNLCADLREKYDEIDGKIREMNPQSQSRFGVDVNVVDKEETVKQIKLLQDKLTDLYETFYTTILHTAEEERKRAAVWYEIIEVDKKIKILARALMEKFGKESLNELKFGASDDITHDPSILQTLLDEVQPLREIRNEIYLRGNVISKEEINAFIKDYCGKMVELKIMDKISNAQELMKNKAKVREDKRREIESRTPIDQQEALDKISTEEMYAAFHQTEIDSIEFEFNYFNNKYCHPRNANY